MTTHGSLEIYIKNISIPKNKDSMGFLHRRVLLIKDNLTRRNWHGSKKYVVFVIKMNQSNICLLSVARKIV
jgi:hypothetical protein